MRVMMPNGDVQLIRKALAVAENRVVFNGRDVRLCECATDIAFANAITFIPEASGQNVCDMVTGDVFLLGNLSNEFVREVLAALVRQDYADLSGLKLQKAQIQASSYVFDHGASDAYLLKGYEANACFAGVPGYPFGGFPVANGANNAVSEAEDTEEDEDEDGDE